VIPMFKALNANCVGEQGLAIVTDAYSQICRGRHRRAWPIFLVSQEDPGRVAGRYAQAEDPLHDPGTARITVYAPAILQLTACSTAATPPARPRRSSGAQRCCSSPRRTTCSSSKVRHLPSAAPGGADRRRRRPVLLPLLRHRPARAVLLHARAHAPPRSRPRAPLRQPQQDPLRRHPHRLRDGPRAPPRRARPPRAPSPPPARALSYLTRGERRRRRTCSRRA
jgi:hypothetical protein